MTLPAPRVSFVIPARDEEQLIAATLNAIVQACHECEISYEMIVVDDASTDKTASLARECGAKVVSVELHNIGAVRNAGAKEALGEILIFLDADTLIASSTLREILSAIDRGAVAGGASVEFERGLTVLQNVLSRWFIFLWQRVFKWAAGCCMFARKEVFDRAGGFDEHYFAAEEKYFTTTLRRYGDFVIVKSPVTTSARKMRIYSMWYLLKVAVKALLFGGTRKRKGLEVLYDAPRESSQARH